MAQSQSPVSTARDNAAAAAWYEATDKLLDSIADASLRLEMFHIASPRERLVILRAQLHWLVDEFFREPMAALTSLTQSLSPEEHAAWQTTVNATREQTRR